MNALEGIRLAMDACVPVCHCGGRIPNMYRPLWSGSCGLGASPANDPLTTGGAGLLFGLTTNGAIIVRVSVPVLHRLQR